MISIESIEPFTQFGVAGLMGALWLWERVYSRKREQQLTQAHERLVTQQTELHELIRLVQSNTAAIERFDKTQSRIADLLDRLDQGRRVA
jgi:leucyl-tRNA synthetase